VLGYVEDQWAKMQASILLMQATARMFLARSSFKRTRSAALALQSAWRGKAVRGLYVEQLQQHRAAVAIQTLWRGKQQQQHFAKVGGAGQGVCF
jgi:myosin-5